MHDAQLLTSVHLLGINAAFYWKQAVKSWDYVELVSGDLLQLGSHAGCQ